MFRLKVFPIIQNILNRNVYNTIHKNHIQCALFSTDALNGSSAGTSINASNGNSDETSINASNENSTGTSTDVLNENSTGTSTDVLNETSTDVLNETSTGTTTDALNESITETSNKTSNETLMKDATNDSRIHDLKEHTSETTVKDSDGSSSNDVSHATKSEPDKLYKKVEIEVRGNDKAVLKSYGEFAVMAAKHLEIDVYRNVALPKPVHERLTVLKSAYVHKKHRVQYETRTYYRYLDFLNLTGSTADTFLEYIQRNLPEGVAMKVTMVELQTLPHTVKQAVSLQQ